MYAYIYITAIELGMHNRMRWINLCLRMALCIEPDKETRRALKNTSFNEYNFKLKPRNLVIYQVHLQCKCTVYFLLIL